MTRPDESWIGIAIMAMMQLLVFLRQRSQIQDMRDTRAIEHEQIDDTKEAKITDTLADLVGLLSKMFTDNLEIMRKTAKSLDETIAAIQRIAVAQEAGHKTTHGLLGELRPELTVVKSWVESDKTHYETRIKELERARDEAHEALKKGNEQTQELRNRLMAQEYDLKAQRDKMLEEQDRLQEALKALQTEHDKREARSRKRKEKQALALVPVGEN